MAEIVLGLGTSHGPMLVTKPGEWALRIPDDVKAMHPWRNRVWRFDELVEMRRDEGLAAKITPEAMERNRLQCQAAIAELARIFAAARIDVAVIVGNDQMEIFDDSLTPAFAVLWADEVANASMPEARLARLPPGIRESVPGYIPAGGATYRGEPALGRHLISRLVADGFDVASMRRSPKPEIPHAYGFVYRHIMRDAPPPSVPVLLNTFYPPNQPSAARCAAFGEALLRAIEAWDSPARVAVIASGGLTHFVIDEELDRHLLESMRLGRIDAITSLDESVFQAGTSEVKNWIPLAAMMARLGLPMTVVDYVPVYRTEAGTGNAMGFVYWQAKEGNPQ